MLYLKNDLLYKIFEMIEERGLQFVMPEQWKETYKLYLRDKKLNKIIAQCEEMADAMELDDE